MLTAEKKIWKTPNGGDFSIVYYFDKVGNTCDKYEATDCLCVEYDKNGKTIHSERAYIIREKKERGFEVSLEQAVQIAKKSFGEKLKLSETCIDIGYAYAFIIESPDGEISIGGQALTVDKVTGERQTEQYVTTSDNLFARLIRNGERINISTLIQKETR